MRRLRIRSSGKAFNILKSKSSILQEDYDKSFGSDLEQNEGYIKETFQNCYDLEYRRIKAHHRLQWIVVYIDSLIDKPMLEEHVLKPILRHSAENDFPEIAEELADQWISIGTTAYSDRVSEVTLNLLQGHAAILTAGSSSVITVAIPGIAKRSLEESSSEPVIRGSKEGFIEQLSTNLGLVRARLKTSKLKTESVTLGELSHTQIVMTYLEGIADDKVIEQVRSRLRSIRIDGVLDSGYIEEFIEDQPYSPFPQVHSTERPDVVAAELLEGKVAILVDTSPYVLIVPMTFWTGLQASEDYYIRWPIATFIRWIRFLFIHFAVFAPALYVAITTFHQEMIPTNLVLSIAGSREAVPFPAMIEALLMEVIFEALLEAGVRMPKQIGPTIGIVGGLVIGQAAVQAGLISAPVVIIVSITGISAFTTPRFSLRNGIRLLRFPMLFLAGTLGLYGIVLGFLGIMLHVTSLRSFGKLYFSPVAPFRLAAFKDVFVRIPIRLKFRFKSTSNSEGGE
ncbi:putative membrane protein YfkQ [Paenibacillus glycanilyticus]|uniref:Membrane protein YfkQ n=1 Tax=Paenibacillus glycanilyticus TaxID=126569 RepID=A0ABQ6NJ91_9BACL|nr:spore germination protein [Paenibacillus glycanilyticus]GMK44569.1 putative membrane protein YfkQ [Paenibacillus glycanilyticus]